MYMKLFGTKPKSDPYALYGREKELDILVERLKRNDWVILLGPRRIGKTSLAECAITELGQKSHIDEKYVRAKGHRNSCP